MKTSYLFVALIAASLLLLAACSSDDAQKDTPAVTGQVTGGEMETTENEKEIVVKDFEILLDRSFEDGGADRAHDDFYDELEKEQFFPQTFVANAGDTVRLVFLLDEPKFVSIDELGIAETVENSVIEFVAEVSGSYSLVCWDCEDHMPAEIIIN